MIRTYVGNRRSWDFTTSIVLDTGVRMYLGQHTEVGDDDYDALSDLYLLAPGIVSVDLTQFPWFDPNDMDGSVLGGDPSPDPFYGYALLDISGYVADQYLPPGLGGGGGAVNSVNGKTGTVILSYSDITTGTVGIARLPTGNVMSTVAVGNDARFTDARTPTAHKSTHATGQSDALSPADIGADTATDRDAAIAAAITTLATDAEVAALFAALGTASTKNHGTGSGDLPTKSQVDSLIATAISTLTTGAPGLLDTLDEIAAAINDDPNFATTMTTALAGKASTVHTHAAADIVSGIIAVARLGSGSPSSANWLRGDGAWTAIAQGDVTGLTAALTAKADASALTTHTSDTGNPHGVTKTQVSLGSVDDVQQLPLSYLDTDGALAANSDAKVASQKANKTYTDTKMPKAGGQFTGPPIPQAFNLTDAATVLVDASQGNTARLTLGGNRTIDTPTGGTDNQTLQFQLKQDATGTRVPTWHADYIFPPAFTPATLTTTANAVDLVVFQMRGTKWLCIGLIPDYGNV